MRYTVLNHLVLEALLGRFCYYELDELFLPVSSLSAKLFILLLRKQGFVKNHIYICRSV